MRLNPAHTAILQSREGRHVPMLEKSLRWLTLQIEERALALRGKEAEAVCVSSVVVCLYCVMKGRQRKQWQHFTV